MSSNLPDDVTPEQIDKHFTSDAWLFGEDGEEETEEIVLDDEPEETMTFDGQSLECPYCHHVQDWLWWYLDIDECDLDFQECEHCHKTIVAHVEYQSPIIYGKPLEERG